MSGEQNAAVIRENFARFERGEGEAVYATWSPDAVWHGLDAGRFHGSLSRDEYFAMLARWAEEVPDYRYEVALCEPCGPELVVVHLRSSGTTPEGPIEPGGGVMVFRLEDGLVVECWAVSRGSAGGRGF